MKRMKGTGLKGVFLILIGASFTHEGFAATWVDGSGAWNVAANWTLPVGVPNAATTPVIFRENSPGATSTVTIPGTFAIQNISFTATTENYILSGGTLSMTPTAGTGITVAAGPTHTITSNLTLLAATTITQNSAGPLTLSGAITGASAISFGASSSTNQVILSGTTANTYSGTTMLTGGIVTLNKTAGISALGGGAITINAASLQWLQSEQIPDASAMTIANAGSVVNLNGNTETIGTLTVSASGTYPMGSGSVLNLSSTAIALSVAGFGPTFTTGQINLTASTGGSVSKSSATGTLTLGNVGVLNGTHDFAAAGAIVITGVVSGNGGLSKSGGSTLTLSGSSNNTYTGTTTVTAGILNMSKSAGVNAIFGDCTLAGGTLQANADNQIADTSNMTITTGTYNMNSFAETMNSLTMNGGTITNNNAGLSLASTGTALTIRNVTVPGQLNLTGASGGDVVQSTAGGAAGTLTNVDLGSAIRNFIVGDIPPAVDMSVVGIISGSGGITKTGIGTLQFSSTGSNTYSGLTTVTQGTLLLNKTAPAIAVAGNILVNGGTAQLALANQIADTSNVEIDSGTFNLNNLAETISSLTYYGGTLTQGTGVLSLASTGTALTMRNTIVNGTINLTGASGGGVVFDDTNGGMAFINTLNLGAVNRTFTVAGGSDSSVKMVLLNSTGAGGALVKSGPGILELLGTNTYTLSTAQVSSGTLMVTGSLTVPNLTQSAGAIIKGTGTITAEGTLNGRLQPGNSIGTINLVGNQTFGSTFILENEINQTSSDLVNITGSLTINPGASVSVIPLVSPLNPMTYTIIQTTTGVSGTFSNVSLSSLFLSASLIYNPLTVQLQIQGVPFSNLVNKGNAGVVARYLDSLTVVPGSDLATVIAALKELTSVNALKDALFQLQPSPLKGLALSQENNAFQMANAILSRADNPCCRSICPCNVWVALGGDLYHQQKIGQEKAFDTTSGHVLVGVDSYVCEDIFLGIAGGYTHSSIDWHKIRDKGDINSGSLSLYGSFDNDTFFIDALLMGSYNAYEERRHIKFSTINRKARGSPQGGQFLGSLGLGMNFCPCEIAISPFIEGDFMFLGIHSFKEKGADSINLKVESSYYNLFRGEAGIDFSRCFYYCPFTLGVDLKLAYLREQRFQGKKFTAGFEGLSTFVVTGMNPSRNAFTPSLYLSFISPGDCVGFTVGYRGEIGERYLDNNLFLNFRISF